MEVDGNGWKLQELCEKYGSLWKSMGAHIKVMEVDGLLWKLLEIHETRRSRWKYLLVDVYGSSWKLLPSTVVESVVLLMEATESFASTDSGNCHPFFIYLHEIKNVLPSTSMKVSLLQSKLPSTTIMESDLLPWNLPCK